jgi:hypothetical protein
VIRYADPTQEPAICHFFEPDFMPTHLAVVLTAKRVRYRLNKIEK